LRSELPSVSADNRSSIAWNKCPSSTLQDRIRHDSRVRSYSILLLGAGLAGLLGVAFDQITVTVSPEYFILGKGLGSEALRLTVAWLGFRSALPLGALVAGLGLRYAAGTSQLSWRAWVAPIFIALALVLPSGALAMSFVDPFDVRSASSASMTEPECARYLVVWGLHVGAYAGVALGLAATLLRSSRMLKRRRTLPGGATTDYRRLR